MKKEEVKDEVKSIAGMAIPIALLIAVISLQAYGIFVGAQEKIVAIAKEDGYRNVIATGDYAWGECGKGDTFAEKFKAVTGNGDHVEGVVCYGFIKGATIKIHKTSRS